MLWKYALDRNILNYVSITPNNEELNTNVLGLGLTVTGKPNDKKIGDQATVSKKGIEITKQVGLAYYANQLSMHF